MKTGRLAVVLGDQLNEDSAVFDGWDPSSDAVWMAEAEEESLHVPSHKARIALFLSAMRHFRDRLRARGVRVHYTELASGGLAAHLAAAVERLSPSEAVCVLPGDWRVRESLRAAVPGLRILPDRHFYSSPEEFSAWAAGRKQLRLENLYRELRKKSGALMDHGKPVGGAWNYDAENRAAFGPRGPGLVPPPRPFPPDAITREVLHLVERRFPGNPGRLAAFDWPVTPEDAHAALDDFLEHRLPAFGQYQDAMWAGEPFLYHSRISAALNLKLLDPRAAVEGAERRWREGKAPLASVEGFIRQILGWREYVRGIYWTLMPAYAQGNALAAHEPLPDFYWTGETSMNCLRQCIGQTLEYGYAHHIQRLMVTGLYALLKGVEPRLIHEWYLAVYVDAVEWVELPNVIGMSQFADGGVMASKPYAASGKYIQRMSNYCESCPHQPASCEFTRLYWDFLERNEPLLRRIPRMRMQLKHLYARLSGRRPAPRP